MNELTRRGMLGSMAAVAAGSLALPARAAEILSEPPPDTEVRFPIDPLPRPVSSHRQILNLRYVTTYVSLFMNDGVDTTLDQRKLQVSVSMSTRHRKGFGIPLALTSVRLVIGKVKWEGPLTTDGQGTTASALYATNVNGLTVPAASIANVTINYTVKGKRKSLTIKDVMVFSPLIVP